MQSAVNALAFPVPDKAWSVALLRRRSDLVLLRTASGETTACVHVHSKAKRRRRMTILYSHANAEDLGLALPFAMLRGPTVLPPASFASPPASFASPPSVALVITLYAYSQSVLS